MKKIKIKDKYLHSSKNDIILLKKALSNKQLSGTSDIISEYENKLGEYFKIPHVVAQSSGSAALQSAMIVLGAKPGDEILVASIAPLPTALPILTIGCVPKFVDTIENTFNFDPKDLERKITKKTKAAIIVSLWGYPIDYDQTLKILRNHKIPLIEDCAQAHGSTMNGIHLGSIGDIGCWSTHDRKIISTGEGGFVASKSSKLAEKIRKYSQLGYLNNFDHGVNFKLSALQAAVGIARINDIEKLIKIRTKNAKRIINGIKDSKITPFLIPEGGRANYYGLVIKLPYSFKQNKVFIKKLEENGIPSDILRYKYKPLYKRKLFSKYFEEISPNTEKEINSITTIPVHPDLSNNEIDYIIETVNKISRKM